VQALVTFPSVPSSVRYLVFIAAAFRLKSWHGLNGRLISSWPEIGCMANVEQRVPPRAAPAKCGQESVENCQLDRPT